MPTAVGFYNSKAYISGAELVKLPLNTHMEEIDVKMERDKQGERQTQRHRETQRQTKRETLVDKATEIDGETPRDR